MNKTKKRAKKGQQKRRIKSLMEQLKQARLRRLEELKKKGLSGRTRWQRVTKYAVEHGIRIEEIDEAMF